MSTAKITLGDDLILCLLGTEYPFGRVTNVAFSRAETDTVRTVHGDGSSSIRPVQTVTKIELECTKPAVMEPKP